jgi:hypothetical protein
MPTTTVYCYHCCAQHPKEQMRLVATKTGNRWRCKKSIDAAAKADKDMALRLAFGQQAAERNKFSAQLARQAKQNKLNNRFKELY